MAFCLCVEPWSLPLCASVKGKTKSVGPFSEALPSLAPCPTLLLPICPCHLVGVVGTTLGLKRVLWGSVQPFQYPFQVCPVVSPACGASSISAFLT